eukprot:291650_1
MNEYTVYNKQSYLMNPSYNMSHQVNARGRKDVRKQNEWDAKQKRIPFKISHSYPIISLHREHDCVLTQREENGERLQPSYVALWKMNLLAVDGIHKSLFIASGNRILVYKLGITIPAAKCNYAN